MARAIDSGQLTAADQMRNILKQAEKRVIAPTDGGGVAELYAWLDEIAALWPDLLAQGADLRAEKTRWESLQSQLTTRATAILSAWKKSGGLPAARAAADPAAENWWWWLDEHEADRRAHRNRRAAIIGLAAVVVIVVAVVALRVLLPVDPIVREVYVLKQNAEAAMQQGDLPGALASYRQAAAVDPGDGQLQAMLGVLSEAAGDDSQAEQAFAAARSLLPSEVDFLVERGMGYVQINEAEKAIGDGEQAVALAPEDGRAWLLLGAAREAAGDGNGAYEAFQQAANLPNTTDPQIVVLARMRMAALMQSIEPTITVAPAP